MAPQRILASDLTQRIDSRRRAGEAFPVTLSPGTSDLPVHVLNALSTFAANNALLTLWGNIQTSMYGVHGAPTGIVSSRRVNSRMSRSGGWPKISREG